MDGAAGRRFDQDLDAVPSLDPGDGGGRGAEHAPALRLFPQDLGHAAGLPPDLLQVFSLEEQLRQVPEGRIAEFIKDDEVDPA